MEFRMLSKFRAPEPVAAALLGIFLVLTVTCQSTATRDGGSQAVTVAHSCSWPLAVML